MRNNVHTKTTIKTIDHFIAGMHKRGYSATAREARNEGVPLYIALYALRVSGTARKSA